MQLSMITLIVAEIYDKILTPVVEFFVFIIQQKHFLKTLTDDLFVIQITSKILTLQ